MPYGSAAIDTIESSGNLAITGNVTTSGTITSSTGTTYPLVSGTAQASTSGTSIDFTSIPSWAKRITVMFNGVSTNGTSNLLIRLGTSSGIVSTGYTASGSIWATTGSAGANSTAGFIIYYDTATYTASGCVTIANVSSNIWVCSYTLASGAQLTGLIWWGGGTVSLASALTQLRITTVNGTDTFDAGTVNILYE